ncbi:DUF420 domain-containing protein [Aureibacillus halotolerans]|uniref:Putative membrane protein n=1 Tax=Aureibacillus halotolerans TaxID=1508390 RepID=A0A4R6U6Z7_9BACI|nr:DUF420 domain-containing protein [Aureibacillus halotolerans]TDQ42288.1 putative membrane protein [Aureibacillus halotolerans]
MAPLDLHFIIPTITTALIVISATLVAIGWYLVKKKKYDAHINVMKTAALFAIVFFIIYVSRSIFLGNTKFGGPDFLVPYYTAFLIGHILLATTGGVFGLVTLSLGYKERYKKHKRIGPITSVIWFCTAVTGTIVYLMLYILFPDGSITNLFDAIL